MEIGDKVPEILGVNQDGKQIKLSDFKGKKLVLYFYPKDNTPGCTAQACSLKDNYSEILSAGYAVLGVSANTEAQHQNFIAKYELPFDLIADTQITLSNEFGVWGEKSMCGRKYQGMFRTTFIIDTEKGVVENIMTPKQVKTKTHGEQILAL